jgi:hypothetical protein
MRKEFQNAEEGYQVAHAVLQPLAIQKGPTYAAPPMSIVSYVKGQVRRQRGKMESRQLLSLGAPAEIERKDWDESLRDPSAFYDRCYRYFHTRLPDELRAHRRYFTSEFRGFGEDAFHSMWFFLFREFKPRAFLEIGVYRGQTLSLASLLQRHFECAGEVVGISPFSPAGDSVTKYLQHVDYMADTLKNFAHFSLPNPTLIKAYSNDPVAVAKIKSRDWDCAYIDGNHDYEVARADWENCSSALKPGGFIVLDDSGLSTSFRAKAFATAGHPGPSRLAEEIKLLPGFREILQVGHNRVFQKQLPK